ncbi:MAG TPA: hypothetical protein VHA09_09150 [Nitrososphaera sp.]|nr:hypothetical protein [Nitrososphaera sp.]
MLLETTRYTVLPVVIALAIMGAMVAPGLTASSAAAQTPSGNETATTTMGRNETSSIPSSGNETTTALSSSSTSSFPSATANETASGTSITLKPSSGATGTNVTISGTGFSPGQTFRFTIDDKYILTGNMVQFATGEFSTTALIPANATSGDHDIKAAGSTGENATATFTVEQGGSGNASSNGNTTAATTTAAVATLLPAASLSPSNETLPALPGNGTTTMPGNVTAAAPGIGIASVVLMPTTANRGSAINVAGKGFGTGQNITLSIDGSSLDMNSTVTTDASGAFTVAFTSPANMTAGSHQVTATDSMGSKASTSLSVIEAPMMPPSPPP